MTEAQVEKYKEIIEKITRDFYTLAINDVFIGYHFRKITGHTGPVSNIEDFKQHLISINAFWQAQLLGIKFPKSVANLLSAHEYLNIRKGELGRWVMLFKQVLKENQNLDKDFIIAWEKKIDTFQNGFDRYFFQK